MIRPLFPFYGSKWRDARRYPAPSGSVVIEPFAGSAGYSLWHQPERVLLYDLDPIVVGVWDYLIHVSACELLRLPDMPEVGDHVDDFDIPQEAKWLIGFWLNRGSAQPKKSRTAYSARTDRAQLNWSPKAKQRIAEGVQSVRAWTITQGSYEETAAVDGATYFVDPPYVDKGRYYRCSAVDYGRLAAVVRRLPGRVIVCEQAGASWLPFAPLASVKSTRGRSEEVVFTRGVDAQTRMGGMWMLDKGDLLVPIETPAGPAEAREAWAYEMGNLLVVVRVLDDRRVRVNCPSTGETVERSAADLLESFERSDAGEPNSWARFITRAATECARVERRPEDDDDTYWRRVAAIATRVRVEESDVAREELARLEQAVPVLADLEEKVLGPFVSTSETSRRAALANYPKQGTQRERIIRLMVGRREAVLGRSGRVYDVGELERASGCTRDELGAELGMPANTIGPRVVELIVGGWLRETEYTRATRYAREAVVLVLSAKVLDRLQAEAA